MEIRPHKKQFYLRRDQNDPQQFILEHTVQYGPTGPVYKVVDTLLFVDSILAICSGEDGEIIQDLLPGTQAAIDITISLRDRDQDRNELRGEGD